MAIIVRNARTSNETWRLLDEDALRAQQDTAAGATGALIPLQLWLGNRAACEAWNGKFGILLQAEDDPVVLVADLGRIELIAIAFARFADGRGYSIARLLRGRYGYRGELRAVGDVLRDQMHYLKRVGFDAFELRADQDPQAAIGAFDDFSEAYQTSIDRPQPLFRRRFA